MPRLPSCIVLNAPQDWRIAREICAAANALSVEPIQFPRAEVREDAVPAALKRKIDAALLVVLVISSDFENSESMRALTKYAFSVKKTLIPYKIHPNRLSYGLQIMLASSHWLDVSAMSAPEDGIPELRTALAFHRDHPPKKSAARKTALLKVFGVAAVAALATLAALICARPTGDDPAESLAEGTAEAEDGAPEETGAFPEKYVANLGGGVKMEFLAVPEGMSYGSAVPAFFLGKTEVSQAQYAAVAGRNPSNFLGDPNRPVEQVSWDDAMAFCALLTKRARNAGTLPDGFVFTLPTDAQWERAFNGEHGEIRKNLDRFAWFGGNSGGKTHPVGTKAPNSRGFHDLCGNVWEWTLSKNLRGLDFDKTEEAFSKNRNLRSYADIGGYKKYDVGFRAALVRKSDLPKAELKTLEGFENSADEPEPQAESVPASTVRALSATLYDLKRSRDGRTTFATTNATGGSARKREMRNALNLLISNGFDSEAVANRYAAAETMLEANQLFIAPVWASDLPAAFADERGRMPFRSPGVLAIYEGEITPPETGEYRFVGAGDDVLLVGLDGVPALYAYYPKEGHGKYVECREGWEPENHCGERGNDGAGCGNAKIFKGQWITLRKGLKYRIAIAFGEAAGGLSGAQLGVQRKGVEENDSAIPIFKLDDIRPDLKNFLKIAPPFVETPMKFGVNKKDADALPFASAPQEEEPTREADDTDADESEKQDAAQQEKYVADLGGGAEMEFVPVPGGKTLGNHYVRAFRIGKTEVTQSQYTALMGTNPSYFKGDENLPVECVSHEDALKFCAKLTARERSSGNLPDEFIFTPPTINHFHLVRDFDGTGKTEEEVLRSEWRKENSDNRTHPVAMKEPNSLGVYDIEGNVSEWSVDIIKWSKNYPSDVGESYISAAGKRKSHAIMAKASRLLGFRVALVRKADLPEDALKTLAEAEKALVSEKQNAEPPDVPAKKEEAAQPGVPAQQPTASVPADEESAKYPPIVSPKKLSPTALKAKYPLSQSDEDRLRKSPGLRWLRNALSEPDFATKEFPVPGGTVGYRNSAWNRRFGPQIADEGLLYWFGDSEILSELSSRKKMPMRRLLYWLSSWRWGIDSRRRLPYVAQNLARDPRWNADFSVLPDTLPRPPREIRLYAAARALAAGADASDPKLLCEADEDFTRLLIEAGANLNARGEKGRSALHDAASRGDAERLQLLINAGLSATLRDDDGATPLHYAALPNGAFPADSETSRSLNAARTLIALGADVNATTTAAKATPLHVAAMNGKTELVALLLLSGADASLKNAAGATAERFAKASTKLNEKERRKLLEVFDAWKRGNKRPAQKAVSKYFAVADTDAAVAKKIAESGAFDWNAIFPNGLVEAGEAAERAKTRHFLRFRNKCVLVYGCKFGSLTTWEETARLELIDRLRERNRSDIIPVLDPAGSTQLFPVIAETLRRRHQPGFSVPQTLAGPLLKLDPEGTADFVLLDDGGNVLSKGVLPTTATRSSSISQSDQDAFFTAIECAIKAYKKRSR